MSAGTPVPVRCLPGALTLSTEVSDVRSTASHPTGWPFRQRTQAEQLSGTMTNTDDRRLERSLDRLQNRLPNWIARPVGGLRKPDARWIRIPAGILFIV